MTINLLKSARYNVFLILYVMIFAGLNSAVFAQTALVADDREAAIYTIYNIEIDETARNVILARQTALAKVSSTALSWSTPSGSCHCSAAFECRAAACMHFL